MKFPSTTSLVPVVMAATLAACAPSGAQEFAVTAAPPSPPGTVFRTSDKDLNDIQGKAYCADGYEKIGSQTQQTDSGTIEEWRIRCTPYTVSFLPF